MQGACVRLQTGHEIGSLVIHLGETGGVCVWEDAGTIGSRMIHEEGEGVCVWRNAKRAGAGERNRMILSLPGGK